MPALLGLAPYRGGLMLVAGLVTVIAACNGNSISDSPSAAAGSVARPSLTQGPAAGTSGPCPLTLGAEGVLPPKSVEPNPSVLPVPWVDRWYGNEAIWIRLPTDGVLPAQPDPAATDHDTDTLYTKFPWWRVLAGQLLASARSLDGSSGQFEAEVGTVSEYGPTGFVPSILTFDHAGCWEITASLGGQTLSFVTRVVARQL